MPILKQFAPQSVSIPNATAQNLELSVEALGALTRLCSYSDNFEFKAEWLQTSWQMGRDQLRNILRELRNAGYLKFVASRNEANTGFEGQEWHLSTSPVFLKSSPPENPSPLDFSETENTEDNKKEEINKKKENKKKTENSDTDGNRPIASNDSSLKIKTDFQCLMEHHANRIGTILDGGAQGKAIKKLLKYFTVDECIACYEYQLTTWRESVSWMTVASGSGIAQWKANGSPTVHKEKTNGKLGNAEILKQYGDYFGRADDNGRYQLGTSDTGMDNVASE